jgi:RNA polymerase sigma factor (sigma-70 family)
MENFTYPKALSSGYRAYHKLPSQKLIQIGKRPYRPFNSTLTPEQRRLVLDNLSLTELVLYKLSKVFFIRKEVETEDLLQQGRLGLCVAAKNWDPNRLTKFSSFAWKYIHGYILHYLRDNSRTVRLCQRTILTRIKIAKLENLGKSKREILEELNIDETEYWLCKLSHLETYISI